MEKTFLLSTVLFLTVMSTVAQRYGSDQLAAAVARLEQANTVSDYQVLENDFTRMTGVEKLNWQPYYYAALCNARIGFMYKDDPGKIESFDQAGISQLNTALSLIDSSKQKKELSEVYCVYSMLYRAKIFISPMSNGRTYGPMAHQFIEKAKGANPDNPRVSYLLASEKFYTPRLWGGSKEKAKAYLDLAMQQLAKQGQTGLPTWGKRECSALLQQYK